MLLVIVIPNWADHLSSSSYCGPCAAFNFSFFFCISANCLFRFLNKACCCRGASFASARFADRFCSMYDMVLPPLRLASEPVVRIAGGKLKCLLVDTPGKSPELPLISVPKSAADACARRTAERSSNCSVRVLYTRCGYASIP